MRKRFERKILFPFEFSTEIGPTLYAFIQIYLFISKKIWMGRLPCTSTYLKTSDIVEEEAPTLMEVVAYLERQKNKQMHKI